MKRQSFAQTVGFLGFGAILLSSQMAGANDFGKFIEKNLKKNSWELYGIEKPIKNSAPATLSGYRMPGQPANKQVKLAKGLHVEYVTREAARHADQFAFWPNDRNPKWLVFCNEIFPGSPLNTGDHPSVQAIRIRDGKVKTILRGLDGCDGIRRTPWGTILATEETSDGYAWEIIKPIRVNNHRVSNRTAGTIVNRKGNPSKRVVRRDALPTMSWEGIHITSEGVVYAGDELRPGTGTDDADGGALYKFIPNNFHTGGRIKNLNDSPLTAGSVYAAQVSCRDSGQQYGQGCEVGNGAWVSVNAASARFDADANGATGYYRPEDMDPDPKFEGPGVKVCWANTQNRSAQLFGEIQCIVDLKPMEASDDRTIVINRLVEGDRDFNAFDNVAFQPHTGNLYVIEDNPNGDIFACLPDGKDRNIKSDGCVKILSVKDSSAEPTGFKFDASGETAYLAIQHSDDTNMPLVDTNGDGTPDFPSDDILKITGFAVPHE